MKLKFLALYCLAPALVAGTLSHQHPNLIEQNAATRKCEIKVINKSSLYANIYGTYDDGTPLVPFTIMPSSHPEYITLYFNGYCHRSIYLDIVNPNGFHVYTKDTRVHSVVKIRSAVNKQLIVENQ